MLRTDPEASLYPDLPVGSILLSHPPKLHLLLQLLFLLLLLLQYLSCLCSCLCSCLLSLLPHPTMDTAIAVTRNNANAFFFIFFLLKNVISIKHLYKTVIRSISYRNYLRYTAAMVRIHALRSSLRVSFPTRHFQFCPTVDG